MKLKIADDFSGFAEFLKESTAENINLCYQCKKCASGCPVAEFMDYTPNQIIHAARLGLKDLVLNSKTIWLCASCETCTTRCPQDIDIVKVMDALRRTAVAAKIKPKESSVAKFYKVALSNIWFFGRMHELSLIGLLKLSTREFTKDLVLGFKMFKKGKLKIFPGVRRFLTVKKIFSKIKNKEK